MSITEDKFRSTEKKTVQDFENLREKVQEVFKLAERFESKYHELPQLLSQKEQFNQEKANMFEKEAGDAMEDIQRIVQELNSIEKKVEELKNDLNADWDMLKTSGREIQEDFNIEIGGERNTA